MKPGIFMGFWPVIAIDVDSARTRWAKPMARKIRPIAINIVANIAMTIGLPNLLGSRMARALRADRERYRGLVEQTVYGIFVIDAKGNFLDVNSAGARMFGFAPNEIIGMRSEEHTSE